MKFALFGNIYQSKKSAAIQQVLSTLANVGAEVYVDQEYYDFLRDNQHIVPNATKVFSGDDFDADFVISMGGDGTFLKAASRVRESRSPSSVSTWGVSVFWRMSVRMISSVAWMPFTTMISPSSRVP